MCGFLLTGLSPFPSRPRRQLPGPAFLEVAMKTARRYDLFFPGTLNRDDSLEDLTVFIPFRLAARIEAYAKQNGSDSTHVVIEAIDTFLRRSSQAAHKKDVRGSALPKAVSVR